MLYTYPLRLYDAFLNKKAGKFLSTTVSSKNQGRGIVGLHHKKQHRPDTFEAMLLFYQNCLAFNFHMELAGDFLYRHTIFHCQLHNLLNFLLFRLTGLSGSLGSKDLLLFCLQRFDAFLCCGDLRIVLFYNSFLFLLQLIDGLIYLRDFFIQFIRSLLRGTALTLEIGRASCRERV